MRVYINFKAVSGPYGGANSFLKTLTRAFQQRGVQVTNNVLDKYDIALLNALTENIDLDFVKRIAARGVPIVHRKVGYKVSGGPHMRRVVDGVVWGDKLQLDFSPYLTHTIFQSDYSREVFLQSGFHGNYSVIPNGVDESVFNTAAPRTLIPWFRKKASRTYWDGNEPLRVVISSWSKDYNKGFEEYSELDRYLYGQKDVKVTLIGRKPREIKFRNIKMLRPRRHPALADTLKKAHVLLQLARFETCSNALIEGINCGLPVIFLDSGANKEMGQDYGVEFQGNFETALDAIRLGYYQYISRIPENPYRIGVVAEKYLSLLNKVLMGATGDGEKKP